MTTPAPRRVLVIHPGALGDVLQAVPALRALAAPEGSARVSLAAQPRLAALLAGAGVADEPLSFDSLGLDALFADAPVPAALADRLAGFHTVVSWFGARAAPYPDRLRALAPGAVLAPPVPESGAPEGEPVWRHLLASVAPLTGGMGVAEAGPLVAPLAIPPAWRSRARDALTAVGVPSARPFLLVHPGAGGLDKRWPAERFAETLAAARGEHALVLHEGPADHDAVAALTARLAAIGAAARPARLVEPDLPLLAGVLAEARAYLGGDSGVSHLAAAVGAAAVIAFPPATRARWAPWGPRALTIAPDDDAAAALRSALTGRARPPI